MGSRERIPAVQLDGITLKKFPGQFGDPDAKGKVGTFDRFAAHDVRVGEVCASEIDPIQLSRSEASPMAVRSLEAGETQIGADERDVIQHRAAQVRAAEIGPQKACPRQVQMAKIGTIEKLAVQAGARADGSAGAELEFIGPAGPLIVFR